MELKQKIELRRLLVPELRQSLNILAMPLLNIKELVENELESNPLLEELKPTSYSNSTQGSNLDFRLSLITKKVSLQDILLRQLGMFTDSDEDFRIGQEIIGNIDENGYLKATFEEIASALGVTEKEVERVLKLIQEFEPAGVGARTVPECLLIQLKLANERGHLLVKIVECHLEDVARRNYTCIARSLNEPIENIEPLIKKILKLNPKPGRNYSLDEIQHVIPDIIVHEKDEDTLEIIINNEDIPDLGISKIYREMLQNTDTDLKTREFLNEKLHKAMELLRAISKRQATLRSIAELVAQIQQEAIKEDFSHLKPLTFKEVAQKLNIHESTVCRAVMNKYVKTPHGTVALKDFFPSCLHGQNGQSVSSSYVKRVIKELIEQEDRKHPLSDEDISKFLANEKGLNVSRRTVAKYREELKILSTSYRRER